jgi:WD40 repeat protein
MNDLHTLHVLLACEMIQSAFTNKIMSRKRYMDRFDSPINPCSVETIPFPLKLADGRLVWPMAVSCYELQEHDDHVTSPRRRIGSVSFFMVPVPDVANDLSGSPLTFPTEPDIIRIESPSGILDGHWRNDHSHPSCTTTACGCRYLFATAHSSGEVQIHALEVIPESHRYVDSDPLIQVSFVCSSSASSSTTTTTATTLCLSVNWEHAAPRLVATYSNGRMAVFDYVQLDNEKASLVEIETWDAAHSLFNKVPAEVWSASFVDRDLIFSGGDDCMLKVWDVRAASRPVQTLDCFTAGVTCISSHDAVDNLVAVGSCKFHAARSVKRRKMKKKKRTKSCPTCVANWITFVVFSFR